MKYIIKNLHILVFTLFLICGWGVASLINTSQASASSGCSYTYCDNGECRSNQNMTDCASPDGTPPCTTHLNFQPDPGVK